MKKKGIVAGLCCGLVLGVSLVSGCSLVTLNNTKYYNAVAAQITYKDGYQIKITRKQLRDAYTKYGFSQYVSNGASQEEAYEATLDYLVSKKLAIRDAEKNARNTPAPEGDSKTNEDDVLTVKEKNYLFEKTFEAMQSNLEGYISKTSGSDSEGESLKIKEYEKQAYLKYDYDETTGTWDCKIELVDSQLSDVESFSPTDTSRNYDVENEEDKEILFTTFQALKTDTAHTDAYIEYLKIIKQSEKGFNLSTDAKSVFMREIDRVYKILYENLMVDKYEDYYMGENSGVTVDKILDTYSNKVRTSYAKYTASTNTSYIDDIKNNSDIYYFRDSENEHAFYVSHILLKFDETQQGQYTALKAEVDGGYKNSDPDKTDKAIENLYTDLKAQVRKQLSDGSWVVDTDVSKTENAPNAQGVLDIIKANTKNKTAQEKVDEFTKLIYTYNEDDGIMEAEQNYVVAVDYSTPDTEAGTSYTLYSSWVDSFENAAYELYDGGNGQVGDIYDGLIKSEYGIHLMMYIGEAKNLFSGINQDFELKVGGDLLTGTKEEKFEYKYGNLDKLYNARINQSINKTYFDKFYEDLVPSDSSIFQTLDLDRLKGETESINYYPQSY